MVPNWQRGSKSGRPGSVHRTHHQNRARLFEGTRQSLVHFDNCRVVKGDIRMQPKLTI